MLENYPSGSFPNMRLPVTGFMAEYNALAGIGHAWAQPDPAQRPGLPWGQDASGGIDMDLAPDAVKTAIGDKAAVISTDTVCPALEVTLFLPGAYSFT